MTAPALLSNRQGAVLELSLNRPDVGNALDIPLAHELMQAIIDAEEDDGIRCLLITAQGRLFCAGGDVAAFSHAGDRLPAFLKHITTYVHATIARMTAMDKPVVVAVNGAAAGAGVGLALAGDIVVGAASAKFSMAYTGIGLSPDGATTWLLPRIIGLRHAQELCLTNRQVKAEEAVHMGMLTRVVPDDRLTEEAWATARQLAAGASQALGATKRLLRDSFSNGVETQMDLESRSIAALSRTPDGMEGIAAFLARRTPQFNGKGQDDG